MSKKRQLFVKVYSKEQLTGENILILDISNA